MLKKKKKNIQESDSSFLNMNIFWFLYTSPEIKLNIFSSKHFFFFFTISFSFIDQTTHQQVEKMIKRIILQWKWTVYEFQNTSVSSITGCKSIN